MLLLHSKSLFALSLRQCSLLGKSWCM